MNVPKAPSDQRHTSYTGMDICSSHYSWLVVVVAGKEVSKQRVLNKGRLEVLIWIFICSQILDNWKYHKPKVASYWLVKLDSTKQRKVSFPLWCISLKTTRSSNRVSVIQRFLGEMNVLGQDWIMEESERDLYWSGRLWFAIEGNIWRMPQWYYVITRQ